MSAHHEEEQIEALKRWWSDYGKTVVVALAAGLAVFFGWNYYQNNQVERAQERSVAFEQLVNSATSGNGELTQQEIAQLQPLANELADTDGLYGDFASLYLAKFAVQQGDLNTAQQHLQSVVDGGSEAAVRDLARYRLARVLVSKEEADAALDLLASSTTAGYGPLYAEARGDILLSQNRLQDARDAYQIALSAIGEAPMRRSILQLKLDNTKVGTDGSNSSPAATNPHALPNPQTSEAGDA